MTFSDDENIVQDEKIPGGIDETLGNAAELLDALQKRANALLAELKAYQSYLHEKQQYQNVEIRAFRRGLESEVKILHNIKRITYQSVISSSDADSKHDEGDGNIHAIRSSNLLHYETVWGIARQCRGIVALEKRLYWERPPVSNSVKQQMSNMQIESQPTITKPSKNGALIDIIADNGLEWIKVCTTSQTRLLYELAKEGLVDYGDESDEDEAQNQDFYDDLELVRLARDLRQASQETRINYRHPRIRFVFTRLTEGSIKDVDKVLAAIKATGITIECHDPGTDYSLTATSSLAAAVDFERLLPDSSMFSPALTQMLNIDCTILLALISDISHIQATQLTPSAAHHITDADQRESYHSAILRQIATETDHPLLPNDIYPIIRSRELTCTSHAAQRMREIVSTMGTRAERERAKIVLGEAEYAISTTTTAKDLRTHLQALSTHAVPEDLQLPIREIQFDISPWTTIDADNYSSNITVVKPVVTTSDKVNNEEVAVPAFLSKVVKRTVSAMHLSPINTSVFVYGWLRGMVTVTSNRVVAMGLVKTINEVLNDLEHAERSTNGASTLLDGADHDGKSRGAATGLSRDGNGENDFKGPQIHVFDIARSLVGKEKQKKIIRNRAP